MNDKFEMPDDPSAESALGSIGGYNKGSSFFDSISCETLDRQSGRDDRPDRQKLRALDVDTFGQAAAHARPMAVGRRGRGGGRGGGGGGGSGGRGGGYGGRGGGYGGSYMSQGHPQMMQVPSAGYYQRQ
eukprot:GHVT01016637.1.p1 GENE.GHVT01016637.1~~GHVT01016637.1.p1  ORF type:complete len:149 (+),score=36.51 GHVT01016637.1:62-448(+)